MNKIKQLSVLICLVMLGIGMVLLAGWDMLRASAAPIPEAWYQVSPIPESWAGTGTIQCPNDPEHFYLVGGLNAAWIDINTVRRYDVQNATWEVLAPLPIVNRGASLACYQGRIYAAGGLNAGMGLLDTLYIYDIALDSWSTGANLPAANIGMALGVWDGKLYLTGGWSGIDPWVPLADVHVYDIATDTWTPNGRPDMPVPSNFGGVIQAGPYLYVVGGMSGDYNNNLNTTQRYNMQDNIWEQGPLFNSRRVLAGMAITEGYLYAVGGDANGGDAFDATDIVERLDLTLWPGGAWMDISDPLPEALMTASFCSESLTGGEIWAVGGLDIFDNPVDSMYYRPSEPCADFYFGDLGPESMATSGFRGETVTYTLSIHNDGTQPDTFSISASFIWNTAYPPTVGPLVPGESAELLVSVDIPLDTNVGDSDTAIITATSQGDPNALDAATLVTTAVTDWTQADPIPVPLAANLVQCPEIPGRFYMVGGILTGNVTSNTLYLYDIAQGWIPLADLPAARRGVAAACYQGKIYVAGGMGGEFWIWETLFIYDILSDTWTSGPELPDPVWGAAMGAWDGKLYLVGGNQTGDPYYTPVSRVDVFDIASEIWTAGGGLDMPVAASFFGSVQTGPYLYAVGGFSGDLAHNVDQTQRYNMATDEQWEIGPRFTSARALGPLAVTSSHLYMLGGDLDGGTEFDITDLVEELDLSVWPGGSWTDMGDPLPEINIYPASTCSEVLTGGEIWSVGGGYVNDVGDIILYDTNLYRPIGDPCVSYGVDLSEPPGKMGEAGSTVEYMVTITNTGVVTDYYTLEISTTWGVVVPPGGPGPVGSGERIQIAISVEVPQGANPGDQGVTEITAASISNPAAFDTTTITTTVGLRDFDLLPISPIQQEDHPGNVLTYTLLVSNIGDFVDSYNVEISATWETTASFTIGPLLPGEEGELLVVVTIPQDAVAEDWDDAVVTLTSQAKPSVTHSATLTSNAIWHRVFMPLALKN